VVVSPAQVGIVNSFSVQEINALFIWSYQQNQQPSSSVFLSQQTSEQCFQHNKPAKRTGCKLAGGQVFAWIR
jgi:hypothetical protein